MTPGSTPPPRIAVLITYHNEGPLLTECLESLWRQPDRPDEIFVYDDASAVPPGAFVPPDIPVRLLRGDVNRGPAHGRNTLVDATSCDFVHFHDADDLFADGWVTAVRAALAGDDVDVVLTDAVAIRDGAIDSAEVMNLVAGLRADSDLVRFGLRGALLLPSSTSRRSVARSIGGFRTRETLVQSEDFDFHIRLAAAVGHRYRVIAAPLVIQRIRPGSHSSDTRAVWNSAAHAVRRLQDELPPHYRPDLSDAAARFATRLYEIGAEVEARSAARLARELGTPRFTDRPAPYRVIAAVLGQEAAESLGRIYRRMISPTLRRLFHD